MPRFLDTVTGDSVWKNGPQDFPYAILSHTWRSESKGGEQSYAEICAIQNEVYAEARKQRKLSVAVVQEIQTIGATQPSAIGYVPRRTSRSSILQDPHTSLDNLRASQTIQESSCGLQARPAGRVLAPVDRCVLYRQVK